MTSYSSNLLGSHNPNIICMDQSGCKLPFPYSELRRFLTPKLLDLYDRVKQAKDIAMAGLENLEECPYCEFKVVIDNPQERLFRCQNRDCEAVTCRECKKPVGTWFQFSYIFPDWPIGPFTEELQRYICCEIVGLLVEMFVYHSPEMEQDKKLDARHVIEEAMSVYSFPQCPFLH